MPPLHAAPYPLPAEIAEAARLIPASSRTRRARESLALSNPVGHASEQVPLPSNTRSPPPSSRWTHAEEPHGFITSSSGPINPAEQQGRTTARFDTSSSFDLLRSADSRNRARRYSLSSSPCSILFPQAATRDTLPSSFVLWLAREQSRNGSAPPSSSIGFTQAAGNSSSSSCSTQAGRATPLCFSSFPSRTEQQAEPPLILLVRSIPQQHLRLPSSWSVART